MGRLPITPDDVVVQAESSRTNVWVPDGLAVRKLPYTPEGVSFALDAATGFALPGVRNDESLQVGVRSGPMRTRTVGGWVQMYPLNWSASTEGNRNPNGPVIVQTKIPFPVRPGMQVAVSGTFKVRTSGVVYKSPISTDGLNDAVAVEAQLHTWGHVVDEYGNEQSVRMTAYRQQSLLQAAGSTAISEMTYTLGDPNDPQWVTIPDHIDKMVLFIGYVDWHGSARPSAHDATLNYRFAASDTQRTVFSSPAVDSTTDNPIRIHVRDPANVNPTYPHDLSATGYAFRNRARFDNVTPGATIVAMGEPDGPAVTVSVYEWTGDARGALLATLDIPPGEKRAAVLDHTGSVDVAGSGTYYVESLLAATFETETIEQTHVDRIEYLTVTDEVSSVTTTLREADLSVASIRFVSDTVDAALPAGKRVRVAATVDEFTPVFTGTVRTRRTVFAPERKQQLEIGVHDVWPRLAEKYPMMFDQLHEYGPALHALGVPVEIDGVDYTGPRAPLPDSYLLEPSYMDDSIDLTDGLLATRNARQAYLYVDRRGKLHATSTLPDEVLLIAADLPGQGDVSYSRELEVATDSAAIVNIVTVKEHLLDAESYNDREVGTGSGPQGPLNRFFESMTQSASYEDPGSVESYGPVERNLSVVRGSGDLADVAANDFGLTFRSLAESILATFATERREFTKMTIPIESPAHIPLVAALQPFSAVAVRHKGVTQVVRPRSVKHTISPTGSGFGWYCELDFAVRRDQVYWLPPAPDVDDPPLIGGFYNNPGPGLVDGGTPEDTGIGEIDGGES